MSGYAGPGRGVTGVERSRQAVQAAVVPTRAAKGDDGAQPAGRRHSGSSDGRFYFRCFPTSFVMSNMFTDALPPKTVFKASSALIMRRFFLSCRPFFLI